MSMWTRVPRWLVMRMRRMKLTSDSLCFDCARSEARRLGTRPPRYAAIEEAVKRLPDYEGEEEEDWE
jgi:hypothetical protein